MSYSATFLTVALLSGAAGDDWRYVLPKPGDAFAHPPLRALALSSSKPDGLKETVRYRGARQRHGRLIYGSGRTAPVAIVVDEVGPGTFDLYLDSDRDGTITTRERVAGDTLTWRVPLKAVVHVGDDVKELKRTVLFRYGLASRTLAVATCGYLEGKSTLDGKEVDIRRCDGDANGLFADPQDRMWIDVDNNGVFTSPDEEFLFAPIVRLGAKRVAVRGDAWGQKLSLAVLEGTGKLKLTLPKTIKETQVREIVATYQSRDGVVATIRQVGGEVTVPTGDYRISSILLTLQESKEGVSWGYIFNDNGGKKPTWHKLARDATLSLDPIGKLDFTLSADDCKAGQSLRVRPALYTGDGLLIEKAYRGVISSGPFEQGCSSKITLMDLSGATLAEATSGFA